MQPPLAPCRDNRVSGIQGSRSGIQGSRLSVLLVQGTYTGIEPKWGSMAINTGLGWRPMNIPPGLGPPRASRDPGSKRTASDLAASTLEANHLRFAEVQACSGLPRAWIRPGPRRFAWSLDPPRPNAARLETGPHQARDGPPRAWRAVNRPPAKTHIYSHAAHLDPIRDSVRDAIKAYHRKAPNTIIIVKWDPSGVGSF